MACTASHLAELYMPRTLHKSRTKQSFADDDTGDSPNSIIANDLHDGQHQQDSSLETPHDESVCKPCVPASSAPLAPSLSSEPLSSSSSAAKATKRPSRASSSSNVLNATCRLLERTITKCPCLKSGGSLFGPMYHSVSVPSISVTEYLRRHLIPHGLYRKEHLLEAYMLHTVVIVDRLIERNSLAGFFLCEANVHRVLLIASVISCKMLDDAPYNNAWWARVGGVSVEHLNELELFTVRALDHRLCVSAAEVEHAREALMSATNETAEAR